MTKNKDWKTIIRQRMRKTGESYTAALAQLRNAPQAERPSAAALAGMTDDSVKAKTGMDWQAWTDALDALDAAKLTHTEIAKLVKREWPDTSLWWTQSVTVGYERIKGIRVLGQPCDSDSFSASKSKTFGVPYATLYQAFLDNDQRSAWLDSPAVVRHSSERSVRFDWPDGTRVVAYFTAKTDQKSMVAIQHTRLQSNEQRLASKQFWAEQFASLATQLT